MEEGEKSMEFASRGMLPAEFQLMLMETALRLMAAAALLTIAAASLTYFMLWLVEFRRDPRRVSAAPPRPRRGRRRARRPGR